MRLPLGSTLTRLFPISLSLLNSDQSALYSAVPDQQLGQHHAHDASINLGILSPYHDAPTVPRVSLDLPNDCTVDQVILLHRHGSRGPVTEQTYILQLVSTLDKASDIIQAADLPSYLQFLKEGYEYQLIPENLTIVGRKELFDHGVEFAARYPTFFTDIVVSTAVPRVIESSHSFSQGFFGLEAEDVTFLTTHNFSDPVSWLDPWKSCPRTEVTNHAAYQARTEWAENYVPPIVDRLNELIPGVNFTLNDTRGALYACAYDRAAHVKTPWCSVFTAHELRGLEYEEDLMMDGISGHAYRGDPGPLLGAFYIKKLVERLTDMSEGAKPLYLEFAHDTTILDVLSTMGLNKDAWPLEPVCPPPHRKFRTSHQAPFAASMVWEKFTCKHSFHGPQVRLVLNGAPLPLPFCKGSKRDKKYGTCSLAKFVQANKYSVSVKYRSAVWNATCELDN